MPGGNQTGPRGMGPMTGRGAGYCAGLPAPGWVNPIGYCGNYGRGRGYRNIYRSTGVPGRLRGSFPGNPTDGGTDTVAGLREQMNALEGQLHQVKARLHRYEAEKPSQE